MSKEETEVQIPKEDPRGFAYFIQQLDDGAIHTELSSVLQKLSAELAEHAFNYVKVAAGTLTLQVGLAVDPNGSVVVVADIKTKTPPPKRGRTQMYLTKGNNLSVENPRQQKLPLREVPSRGRAREVPNEERETRTL